MTDLHQCAKGYDLPIDEQEEREAENDCKRMMELVFDIYKGAGKGKSSNVVLSDEQQLSISEIR